MNSIPARLRRQVVRRAKNRCEYCLLAQVGQEAAFHIDHIIPEAHGGPTEKENLALAYVSCSLRKGVRRSAIDPETGKRVRLFHPRQNDWHEHFRWDGFAVEGITSIGRATVGLLRGLAVPERNRDGTASDQRRGPSP